VIGTGTHLRHRSEECPRSKNRHKSRTLRFADLMRLNIRGGSVVSDLREFQRGFNGSMGRV
jgi:hypothetical protein